MVAGGFLRSAFAGRKGVVQKSIEVVPQRLDAGRIQFVQPAVPRGPIDDEVRIFQDAQVLRDGRPADRESARELTHRLRSGQQPLENRPTRGIAKGVQLFGVLVSNH